MFFMFPQALWLILLVPPLVVLFGWVAWRGQKRFLADYGEWRLIARFSAPLSFWRFALKATAFSLALSLIVLALARPIERSDRMEYPIGTVDVVAVVDVSRSMAIPDYAGKIPGAGYEAGTRLDMARYLLLNEIVPALGYNQLGVVAFSGTSFAKAFITDDLVPLKWQLNRSLTIGSVPGEGSQLAGAFNLAAALFDLDSPATHRRVVALFSDGGNDSPDDKLIAAMKTLKQRNIDLVVVGLGSLDPHPIPIKLLSRSDQIQFRDQDFYVMDGQIARSALDEGMLIAVKDAIGGRYVRVDNISDFHIGSLVRGVDVKYIPGQRELFWYPLLAALPFLLLTLLAPRKLSQFADFGLWRRKEQPTEPARRTGNDKKRK
jgi:hypothetical protein